MEEDGIGYATCRGHRWRRRVEDMGEVLLI